MKSSNNNTMLRSTESIGTMEREPISKNRVSPKNDRSRRNLPGRLFLLALVCGLATTVITSCGGGSLPNGRYEPPAAGVFSAIIIKGNNFTAEMAGIAGITAKYEYKDGKIIFKDGGAALSTGCEFRNDTLFYAGVPFVKK
jgi:hypothetical protein